MSTSNTKNVDLSDLSRVSEQIENSSGIDWDRALQEVCEFIHSFEEKHTTEIVNEIKKSGFGLFDILKNLGKIDENRTRLIESIPAYAPCPETNMYYYVTTDGCIVNSRTLQVTELDDSFWDYLKFFHQEIGSEGDFSASTS